MKVCIFGQMHNGKTTFAHLLHQELLKHDYVFYLASWAAPIKTTVCKKYLVTLDYIAEWKNRKEIPPGFNVTMREVLQKEGEHSRECMEDVWVKNLMYNYQKVNTIIDDGRYPNEAKAVFVDGGYNILLIRPDYINKSEHPSEYKIGSVIDALKNNEPIPHEWVGLFHEIIMNSEDVDSLAKVAVGTAKNIVDKIKYNVGMITPVSGSTNKETDINNA